VLYAGETPTYRVMPGSHRRHLAVQVHERVARIEEPAADEAVAETEVEG